MKAWKRVAIVGLAAVLSVVLSGCSVVRDVLPLGSKFTDAAGGESYLLQKLEEKYGFPFVVVGDARLMEEPVRFVATVAPVGRLEETAIAVVKPVGGLADDFGRNLYKEEIEGPMRAVCASKDYLESYKVSIFLPTSRKKWDASTPLDVFLKESGVSVDMWVTPSHEDTDDEYATDILDLLDGLYAQNIWFSLGVEIGGQEVFGTNWYPSSVRKPTRELILESLYGRTGN